jgi:hypothetical protein
MQIGQEQQERVDSVNRFMLFGIHTQLLTTQPAIVRNESSIRCP